MRSLILFILLTVFADDINRIAFINRLKKEAETAYKNEQYQQAVEKYNILVDSLGVQDDKVLLNLSNAYFHLNDTSNAGYLYSQLTEAEDKKIKSIAYQQLGVMANDQNKHEESLQHFKSSLKADPGNEDARYNYELLKKMIREQKQQQQQQQQDQQQQQQQQEQQDKNQQDQEPQEQQQQDQQQQEEQQQQEQQQQEQEQKAEEQEASEQENEDKNEKEAQPQPQNLEDMKISEEMARKILEAMRNNEIQYLQQQKRKSQKPADSSKPDW